MNLKLNVNKMAFFNHSIRFRSVYTLITNLPEVMINKTYIYIFPLMLLGRKPEKSGYICIFFLFSFLEGNHARVRLFKKIPQTFHTMSILPNTENQDLSILLSFYSHKELEKLKIELKFLEIFTSKELFV